MDQMVLIISAIIILVFLFMKVPVFIAILAGSVCYFAMTPGLNTQIFAQRFIAGIELQPLLAVPFFICSAAFMNITDITMRIMNFCEVVTGRMYGGLAQVNILVSTLMGGLSGSALADASMDSKMLVPNMVKKGFSKPFSCAVTAVSAIITPLIPPGISMILYGSIANISIGKLFIAGFGPGLLLCFAMMALTGAICRRRGHMPTRTKRISPGELVQAFRPAALPLLLPIIIIGGVRFGVFTPTEAGAVAIIYAVLLGLIFRKMERKDIFDALKDTVLSTSAIMLIVGAASAYSWILTKERIPQLVTEYMLSIVNGKYMFLLVINLFLLIVGMFLEGNAALIVLVPLLAPLAAAYGINEIHFAMVFIFNLSIGAVTPPVGTLMFVTCGITKCKIIDFIKEMVPYYLLLLVCLATLSLFPVLTTGIVELIY